MRELAKAEEPVENYFISKFKTYDFIIVSTQTDSLFMGIALMAIAKKIDAKFIKSGILL